MDGLRGRVASGIPKPDTMPRVGGGEVAEGIDTANRNIVAGTPRTAGGQKLQDSVVSGRADEDMDALRNRQQPTSLSPEAQRATDTAMKKIPSVPFAQQALTWVKGLFASGNPVFHGMGNAVNEAMSRKDADIYGKLIGGGEQRDKIRSDIASFGKNARPEDRIGGIGYRPEPGLSREENIDRLRVLKNDLGKDGIAWRNKQLADSGTAAVAGYLKGHPEIDANISKLADTTGLNFYQAQYYTALQTGVPSFVDLAETQLGAYNKAHGMGGEQTNDMINVMRNAKTAGTRDASHLVGLGQSNIAHGTTDAKRNP